MQERFKYHFEPNKGWMNDPNGLVFYKGYYHAFFQHNPKAPKWDTMHWGHAISMDLLNWEECDIALYPDMDYEDDGGCFSGSAVEKDGRLYLFYTSVSHKLGQTQSVAYSDDGFHFTKYEGNPVISHYPEDGSKEFRDPKVIKYEDHYLMVVGSCKDNKGRVLLYKSFDLLSWDYVGILYEADDYSGPIECPDLFYLKEQALAEGTAGGYAQESKYILMYSRVDLRTHATQFIVGTFDGQRFIQKKKCTPEMGPQFYAPQTFEAPDGRRILIGWFYDWKMEPEEGLEYAGALTIPREVTLSNDKLLINPVMEAESLLVSEDENVIYDSKKLKVTGSVNIIPEYVGIIKKVSILKDGKGLEIFINEGECSISSWLT